MNKFSIFLGALLILTGCHPNKPYPDAYGNFEAVEYNISAEESGKLLMLKVEEGDVLEAGELIGFIDTVQLYLRKAQLFAQKRLSASKLVNIQSQLAVAEEQKKNLLRDQKRIENMLKDEAVPQKQLDDIIGNLNVLESQMISISTQKQMVAEELRVTDKQIDQVNDQIARCFVINPIKGTVLEKFSEPFELVGAGKPLYKLADLETLELTAYISGKQLASVKIGDTVQVSYDAGATKMASLPGVVSWIASKSEFTPKIIQTREERVNLVYAIKVRIRNKGEIKIGMPGEVCFAKK